MSSMMFVTNAVPRIVYFNIFYDMTWIRTTNLHIHIYRANDYTTEAADIISDNYYFAQLLLSSLQCPPFFFFSFLI